MESGCPVEGFVRNCLDGRLVEGRIYWRDPHFCELAISSDGNECLASIFVLSLDF